MSTIAQDRADMQAEYKNLMTEIERVFDQPVKRKSKTEIKEEFRKLVEDLTENLLDMGNFFLDKRQEFETKLATLEWYFNEKVEAHKQALLDKDKQIEELKQQLSAKINS